MKNHENLKPQPEKKTFSQVNEGRYLSSSSLFQFRPVLFSVLFY